MMVSITSRGIRRAHGDMKQMQRDRVMDKFKRQFKTVATDVAARGLDITGVEAVLT